MAMVAVNPSQTAASCCSSLWLSCWWPPANDDDDDDYDLNDYLDADFDGDFDYDNDDDKNRHKLDPKCVTMMSVWRILRSCQRSEALFIDDDNDDYVEDNDDFVEDNDNDDDNFYLIILWYHNDVRMTQMSTRQSFVY